MHTGRRREVERRREDREDRKEKGGEKLHIDDLI